MTDHDEQAKIDRLNELRNNPLFPKKPKSKPETPDESLKPSEPTQLSQHIYDKLYPYFTDILNKLAGATKPLYLDSEFYINLAQAIRVERWNDNCSIKLWILINNLKSVLPKNTGNKWSDLYRTAKDIHKKIQSDHFADAENTINSFTCPRGQWIDYDGKGSKPRPTVENCIVALRFILEDDKLQLQYDTWKRAVVVVWPP